MGVAPWIGYGQFLFNGIGLGAAMLHNVRANCCSYSCLREKMPTHKKKNAPEQPHRKLTRKSVVDRSSNFRTPFRSLLLSVKIGPPNTGICAAKKPK